MDWWLYAAQSMILLNCNDEPKCYHHLVARTQTQMMMTCIASVFWAITMLKLRDVVLATVKVILLWDAWMELRNASVFSVFHLFALDISKAAEKSGCALHDEAIRKAVAFKKLPSQSAKQTKVRLCSPRLPLGSVWTATSPQRLSQVIRDQPLNPVLRLQVSGGAFYLSYWWPYNASSVRWLQPNERWASGIPLQVPILSSVHSVHLQNLTTAGIWTEEEHNIYINIMEMKAV